MKIEVLRQIVADLSEKISGSRIAKIHQPSADLFVLRLWTGRENLKLLLSVAPRESLLQFTDQTFPNPFTPPRFCQLLRARLSRISGVSQLNDDRIVEFRCQGPKGDCRLIAELTGKSSNLILVDNEGQIIDSLKRQEDGRIAPGRSYLFPEKQSVAKIGSKSGSEQSDKENVGKIYTDQVTEATGSLRARLDKLISKEMKKLRRRLSNIRKEQERQEGFERYRQQGDLLLANLHLIKRGMEEVDVVNYYLQPQVSVKIDLDPLLSPQDNAERYFKKYKKAKRGLEHSARRIYETERELEWFAQLAYQLESALEPADISLVVEELKNAGLLKEKAAKLPRLQKSAVTFKETVSPSGYKVLWGTNSKQNDALSTKILKKGDLWFHAHRCPGSHVVLKADSGRGQFSEEDIIFAASIAAVHSKAGQDSKVEVMLAAAKDIKKPPGAKPGMVTVAQHKTVVVKPHVEKADVF